MGRCFVDFIETRGALFSFFFFLFYDESTLLTPQARFARRDSWRSTIRDADNNTMGDKVRPRAARTYTTHMYVSARTR